MKFDRRQFLSRVARACASLPVLSATGLLTAACGIDTLEDLESTQGQEGGDGTFTASFCSIDNITDHGGHIVGVTLADVQAGVAKTYDMTGAGHEHQFTLTAADFTQLASGTPVTVEATVGTGNGHIHNVTIACV